MALDFTAIDFETANEERASVCAVGVAQVRGGHIVERTGWYVQPPTGDRFTNTMIHGITAETVRTGSTWADSLAAIESYVEGHIVVAFNSPFYRGVYSAASRAAEVDPPDLVWRCARLLAKTHLVLNRYRLVDVVEHLDVARFLHHDATEDASACAGVVLAIAERHGGDTVDALWPIDGSAQRERAAYRRVALPPADGNADPAHPLFGASISFTGELLGFTREEAREAVARLGATVTATPTRKTDVVVVGGFEPATLRPGAVISGKLQRAMDLRAAGQRIELIGEADLAALLAYEPGR